MFLDTRNATAWTEAMTKLPGAIGMSIDEVEPRLDELPARDRPIITLQRGNSDANTDNDVGDGNPNSDANRNRNARVGRRLEK